MHQISDIVVESSERSLRTVWTPHAPLVTPWKTNSESSPITELDRNAIPDETHALATFIRTAPHDHLWNSPQCADSISIASRYIANSECSAGIDASIIDFWQGAMLPT